MSAKIGLSRSLGRRHFENIFWQRLRFLPASIIPCAPSFLALSLSLEGSVEERGTVNKRKTEYMFLRDEALVVINCLLLKQPIGSYTKAGNTSAWAEGGGGG